MKSNDSIYEAPLARSISVASSEGILANSSYGERGRAGNYDIDDDEDYGNF